MRIILIDDEIAIIESLKFALEPAGHKCELFTNPVNAIKAFRTGDYDAIVTDFKMPEMTGIDILKEVRKLSSHAPVIILTGYADIDNAIEALNFGASAFFRKPFAIKDLMEVLVRVEMEIKVRNERKDIYLQLKKELENCNSNVCNSIELLDKLYIS